MIHICTKKDERWKRLPKSTYVATQYPRPERLESNRWIQNISPDWYKDGNEMAAAVSGGLSNSDGPAYVLIDELKAGTIDKVADTAAILRNNEKIKGKWGAYLVNGTAISYAKLNPAIDRLLEANAIVVCEMYLKMSLYERLGESYLTNNIWGNNGKARLKWLIARRKAKQSKSNIVGLIGLTPTYLDRPKGSGNFIREMMKVWEQVYPGPMGAWKWDVGSAIEVAPQWPGWASNRTL